MGVFHVQPQVLSGWTSDAVLTKRRQWVKSLLLPRSECKGVYFEFPQSDERKDRETVSTGL